MKSFLSLMLAAIMTIGLFAVLPASAAMPTLSVGTYVVDENNYFTAEQKEHYQQRAQSIAEQYGEHFYYIIIDEYSNEYEWLHHYTYDLFNQYDFLYDNDLSCTVMIYSVQEDQYDITELSSVSYQTAPNVVQGMYITEEYLSDYFLLADGYLQAYEMELSANAQASSQSITALESLVVSNVMDTVDLLSESEEQALTTYANQLESEYNTAFYILTVQDYNHIAQTTDAYYAATEFYSRYDLGHGAERDGVLLMLSMQERDYAYITYGPTAESDFPNDIKITIEEEFLYHFGFDDWYAGFYAFLEESHYEYEYGWRDSAFALIVCIFVAFCLSLIVGVTCRAQLKTVSRKAMAHEYVPKGGITIHAQSDVYSHETTSRVKMSSSSSGGGGGGRSFSGGGFSGRSGKF